MAKLERTLSGDMNELLERIETGILAGSISATLEDKSDFTIGDTRCAVRVYERYSYAGSNRVSLSVTLFLSVKLGGSGRTDLPTTEESLLCNLIAWRGTREMRSIYHFAIRSFCSTPSPYR